MSNPFANTIKFLTAVDLLASPSGTTIRELMRHLDISRRTAFRLLDALEELGFPIVSDHQKPGNEKTYRLIDAYVLKLPNITLPNPYLTSDEIELVITILDLCKQISQISGVSKFNSIKAKLKAVKPKDGAK